MVYSHIFMVMLGEETGAVQSGGDRGHYFLFIKFFKIFYTFKIFYLMSLGSYVTFSSIPSKGQYLPELFEESLRIFLPLFLWGL